MIWTLKVITLILADVFKNSCWYFKIYELDPEKLPSALGLARQAAFKKAEVKCELLTDIDILLMVEKWVRGGICHFINRYATANNKYMKDFDKSKAWSYLRYCEISQTLPGTNSEWAEDISEFDERFIKSYNEQSDEGQFLEVDIQYPEKLLMKFS